MVRFTVIISSHTAPCRVVHRHSQLTRCAVPGPARSAEIEFLTTGNVSASSNETLATIYYPGDVRAALPDPYSVLLGPLAGDVNINGTLA